MLTDAKIRALKAKPERYEVFDGGGFGVRVTPRGVKSFVYVYHHGGKPRRLTLGHYPSLGLADARIKLAEAKKALEKGNDPGAAMVTARRAERDAETVADLATEYVERHAKRHKRTWQNDKWNLDGAVLPVIGKMKAKDVRRRDIIALLDDIVARGAPVQANRIRALLSKLFNFAVAREVVEHSPVVGVPRPATEKPRERILSDDEIKSFWGDLDKCKMAEGTRLALKFLLVTAQRAGEVVGASWPEINGEVWTLPGERTKNGKPHSIPLSAVAVTLLDEIKEAAKPKGKEAKDKEPSPWLFPSRKGKAITVQSLAHAIRNNADALTVKDFSPHDLRRTAASGMTALGIPRLTVSKVLNHAEAGVTGRVYDKSSYDREKADALAIWSAHLQTVIEGKKKRGNVVRLKGAR